MGVESGSEFNVDLGFSGSQENARVGRTDARPAAPIAGRNASDAPNVVGYLTQSQGFSVFVLDDGPVYHAYSTGARGSSF